MTTGKRHNYKAIVEPRVAVQDREDEIARLKRVIAARICVKCGGELERCSSRSILIHDSKPHSTNFCATGALSSTISTRRRATSSWVVPEGREYCHRLAARIVQHGLLLLQTFMSFMIAFTRRIGLQLPPMPDEPFIEQALADANRVWGLVSGSKRARVLPVEFDSDED